MHSAHPPFKVFEKLSLYLERKIVFVSELTPNRDYLYRWIHISLVRQVIYQATKSFDMAGYVLKQKGADAIIIFEHKPQYSLPLYVACLLKKVPVFFFVHGIQQTANRSLAHSLGFRLLQILERRYNFWPLHLEMSDRNISQNTQFKKSIVVPHPLPTAIPAVRKPVINRKVRLGIIGILRNDKPIAALVDLVTHYASAHLDCELIIGTPFWQLSQDLIQSQWSLVDTSSEDQYFECLNSVDVVITYFDKASFYFRPSGVISDALAMGCYVLAPDYPVLSTQIRTPIRVGDVYATIDQIPALLDSAIKQIRAGGIDHREWRTPREDDVILTALSNQISSII